MLRNREMARPMSRGARRGLLGMLVIVAALTSSLRAPAEAKKPTSAPVSAEAFPPFDLSYVCTDQTPNVRAVLAIRPGVIVRQAGLKENLQSYIEVVKAMVKKAGRTYPDIEVEDIEQVVMDVHFTTQGTGKPNSRSLALGMSGVMVRLTKEVDWEKVLRGLCPDVKVKEEGGLKVFQVSVAELGPAPMILHAPDRRTLVMGAGVLDPKGGRVLKRGKPRLLAAGWQQVERSALAFAIDNRDGHYAKTFAHDVKDCPEMKAVLQQFRALAGAADFSNGIRGELHADAKDEASAVGLLAALKDAFLWAQRAARARVAGNKEMPERDRVWFSIVDDIVTAGRLNVSGRGVKGSSQSTRKLTELIPGF